MRTLGTIFQARHEGERHHHYETILRYVQKAPDDFRWEIDSDELNELMATEKESALGPGGNPYSLYRCAGGLGLQFLFNAYEHSLEGDTISALSTENRTVFLPKSSDVDNNGRIVRSAEALRPLTLCKFDCKIFTTALCRGLHWCTMRCIHPSPWCISAREMTDNIFEIDTAAVAHVARAPRESGILLTDSAAAYFSVNQSWIFPCTRESWVARVPLPFLAKDFLRQHHARGICRSDSRSVPHGQESQTRMSSERLLVWDVFRTHLSLAPGRNFSKEPCWPGFLTAGSVRVCRWLRGGCSIFQVFNDRFGSCLSNSESIK